MSNPLKVQVGGSHYKDMAIQPVTFNMKNKLDFCQGSVIKYVTRHENKDKMKDLKKAQHFIRLLAQEKYPEQAHELYEDDKPVMPEKHWLAIELVDIAMKMGEVTLQKLRDQVEEAKKDLKEWEEKKHVAASSALDTGFRTESGHHFQD